MCSSDLCCAVLGDAALGLDPRFAKAPDRVRNREVLVPAGYVTTAYDPVFTLSADRRRYVDTPSKKPTELAAPGLPTL